MLDTGEKARAQGRGVRSVTGHSPAARERSCPGSTGKGTHPSPGESLSKGVVPVTAKPPYEKAANGITSKCGAQARTVPLHGYLLCSLCAQSSFRCLQGHQQPTEVLRKGFSLFTLHTLTILEYVSYVAASEEMFKKKEIPSS